MSTRTIGEAVAADFFTRPPSARTRAQLAKDIDAALLPLLACREALAGVIAWHDWCNRTPPPDESVIPPAALRSLPSLLSAGRRALDTADAAGEAAERGPAR